MVRRYGVSGGGTNHRRAGCPVAHGARDARRLQCNAREAGATYIDLLVGRESQWLNIAVRDNGPGFDADMLADFGKPYRSSKGRQGGGLGPLCAWRPEQLGPATSAQLLNQVWLKKSTRNRGTRASEA